MSLGTTSRGLVLRLQEGAEGTIRLRDYIQGMNHEL